MACGVYEAVIHTAHASDQELPNVLWTVTDGALTVKAMGGGVVLYHPLLGILRQLSFRFQVTVATSADAEWLPKLVARYMLRKWLGHAHFIADTTAALHGTHTNFLPPSTYTNHIHRRVVAATASFQEILAASSARHRSRAHRCQSTGPCTPAGVARGVAGATSHSAPPPPPLVGGSCHELRPGAVQHPHGRRAAARPCPRSGLVSGHSLELHELVCSLFHPPLPRVPIDSP